MKEEITPSTKTPQTAGERQLDETVKSRTSQLAGSVDSLKFHRRDLLRRTEGTRDFDLKQLKTDPAHLTKSANGHH